MSIVDVTTNLQVLIHLGAKIGTRSETLVVGINNDTVNIEPTERQVILCFVATTIYANAILLTQGSACHYILPVNLVTTTIILGVPNLVNQHVLLVGNLSLTQSTGESINIQHI